MELNGAEQFSRRGLATNRPRDCDWDIEYHRKDSIKRLMQCRVNARRNSFAVVLLLYNSTRFSRIVTLEHETCTASEQSISHTKLRKVEVGTRVPSRKQVGSKQERPRPLDDEARDALHCSCAQ